MSTTTKQRDANLDLLRIVSMLLIVFLHSIDHSGVLENAANCGTPMYFYVRFTYALCQVCVNIYIMLSGYYMVKSKFRLHKLVNLWMEATFYSFVLKLIFMLTGADEFSIVSLASCFFPITTGRYWFLTIYVGMYLISPFLNILINAMNKQQHGLLNLLLFGLCSLWVSIHPSIAGMNSGGGWGLMWFIVLYITAAWFRLYYAPNHKPLYCLSAYLVIPFMIASAQVILERLNIGILQSVVSNWFRYDSAPVYLMTIFLFVGFLNIRIKQENISALICRIAPLTFGVYLIHAHANVSPWSWDVLNLPGKMSSVLFPLIQIGSVFAIFLICIGIDFLKKSSIGKLEQSTALKNFCDTISKSITKYLYMIISSPVKENSNENSCN